jgi:hypothetical protein
MVCGPGIPALISATYPILQTREGMTDEYFLERAILCPRNSEVDEINQQVLQKFPGEARLYSSADSVKGGDGEHYPVEYLNSITIGGLPPLPAQTQDWSPFDASLELGFESWTVQWNKTLFG